MTELEEKLEISEFNYNVLKDEYKKLKEKYDELNGYYDDLNERYVKKLNAYNATVVKTREIEKENNKLVKINKEVNRDFYIMFVLLLVSLAFYFIG